MNPTLKEMSREHWNKPEGKPTVEQINCGSLQRIADSMEFVAKERDQLKAEIQRLKRENIHFRNRACEHYDQAKLYKRRAAGYKGKLTQAKKEIERLKTVSEKSEVVE